MSHAEHYEVDHLATEVNLEGVDEGLHDFLRNAENYKALETWRMSLNFIYEVNVDLGDVRGMNLRGPQMIKAENDVTDALNKAVLARYA